LPIIQGFLISNILNRINPIKRVHSFIGIVGEQNNKKIPITSSITMIGLSAPSIASTFGINLKDIINKKNEQIARIGVRKSSGRKKIISVEINEANVPGNFGK
jgi:hypothetical protein